MVDKLLDGVGEFASVYISDIIIFSPTWELHSQHLEPVLRRVLVAGLTIKKRKCQFAMSSCVYLGHRVGSGRVSPDEVKVDAIKVSQHLQLKSTYGPSWG